jgi:polysaccharide biosynthesis/export protein
MFTICLLLALAGDQASPVGPNVPARPAAAPSSPAPAGYGAQDYRIGPGDVLRVTVYGYDDLNQTVVVQPSGGFVFPLIGSVQAAQATPAEVERRVAAKLSKGLIRDPKVTVDVREYRSKEVFVMGEVAHPGAYPLAGDTRLVEILARAGPFSQDAGGQAVIVRRGPSSGPPPSPPAGAVQSSDPTPDPRTEVIRVDLRALESGRLESNVLLQPNDTVFVPQAARIFVSGEVRNPGAFTFRPGLTVRQAVSLAGGPTPVANAGKPRVVREIGGKPKTLKVRPDDPVEAGDTVVLGTRLF